MSTIADDCVRDLYNGDDAGRYGDCFGHVDRSRT